MEEVKFSKDKILWSLVSFVRISKFRQKIVIELGKKPQFPSELVKNLKIPFPVVSKYLKELEDVGIIICLNPEQKKGRMFSISQEGEEIILLLKEILNIK